METIIIEIYLPGNNQILDFSVPSQVCIGSYIKELIHLVNIGAKNVFIDDEHPMICDMRHKCPLPFEKTLAECHVRDGDRLMLL
ncbi:MAG: EsaB/YukD family protein [Clostridia bacterium]|nr:EsaB/YukD family protein [Clostridia bacterium]